jgi:uncharacterized membrane protein (UPF0182 family)
VDVDRYVLHGAYQQVMLSARENEYMRIPHSSSPHFRPIQ